MKNELKSAVRRAAILLGLSSSLLSLPSALHAVPLRWTVETSRAQPATFDQFAGASYEFEARMESYGRPLAIDGEPMLYWQTNGMGAAWWSAPAEAARDIDAFGATTTVFKATWTPAYDVGARAYSCFVGITGTVYNAAFQLRLRPSPGAVPNVIDQPPRVLDLAHTVVVNPPWPTTQELKDYVDEQIISAGVVSPPIVTNISHHVTTATVTKAYVEGLGIDSGLDTNAVKAIAADAAAGKRDKGDLAVYAPSATNFTRWTWTSSDSFCPPGWLDAANAPDAPQPSFDGEYWRISNLGGHSSYSYDERLTNPLATELNYYFIGDYEWLATATRSPTYEPIDDTLAKSSSVARVEVKVDALVGYFHASNVWLVVTNYDSEAHAAQLQLRDLDDDGNERVIWDQRTLVDERLGERVAEVSNLVATLYADLDARKADRAWGKYTSGLGVDAPEGTTWISTSNLVIAGGLEYQKTVTSNGGIYVLTSNGMTVNAGADTNGYFRVSDDEGNSIFEIAKTAAMEVGADATGITVTPPANEGASQVITIPYGAEVTAKPTLFLSREIGGPWDAENEGEIIHSVSWSSSAPFVATVQLSAGEPQMFFKAKYLREGSTVIRHSAPAEFDTIVINGVKYRASVKTISGQTVLGLDALLTTP